MLQAHKSGPKPKTSEETGASSEPPDSEASTGQHVGVSLQKIIDAGVVQTPLRLFCTFKGQVLEATLHEDGAVEFQGERFRTCSSAAEKARSLITGRKMNTNGWTFWKYQDASGEERELVKARSEYLAKVPTAPEQTEEPTTGTGEDS